MSPKNFFGKKSTRKKIFTAVFIIAIFVAGGSFGYFMASRPAKYVSKPVYKKTQPTSVPAKAKNVQKKTTTTTTPKTNIRPVAKPTPATPVPVSRPAGEQARVAIVLDDWGYNLDAWSIVEDIPGPLTFAILPHLQYSEWIGENAHEAGHEIILHMPMEPKGKVGLEEHTLLVGMDEPVIRRYLLSAINSIPHLDGINNHMGSKFTENSEDMHIVMRILKSRRLFFLNSFVTGSGVPREAAENTDLPYYERDVFIDNVRTSEHVLEKLEELKEVALRKGYAIGIGHDEPVTLRAIRQVLPEWKRQGVVLVKLSDLDPQ